MKTRWWAWLPAGLWSGALFWMSSRPAGPVISPWFLQHDKVTHALAYGVLAALIYFALRMAHDSRASLAAVGAWALATAYGATDEFHQMFVPTRIPDGWDILADSIGATLAVILLWTQSRLSQ